MAIYSNEEDPNVTMWENQDKIICNNCGFTGEEEDLKTIVDLSDNPISHDIQYITVCPCCETDEYLMGY